MGLATISAEIMGYVDARLALGVGVLSWSVGTREKFRNHKAPRVIFEPGDDSFLAPRQLVAAAVDRQPVATRVAGATVYVWGRTVAEVEAMVEALVVGCRDVAIGFPAVVAGQWREAEGMVDKGELYTFKVQFPVPQCRVPVVRARIDDTAFDGGSSAPSDGVLNGGE